MATYKKPLFTLVPSNDAIVKQKSLSYWDKELELSDHTNEIFDLRIKKLKLHHSQYTEKEYTKNHSMNNNRGFSFIFHEIFESEHHEKQIGMLKDDIAVDKESNKIRELLGTRLKEITQVYPDLKLDLNDFSTLPTKIKDHLFAPPLILVEGNSIMLWDD